MVLQSKDIVVRNVDTPEHFNILIRHQVKSVIIKIAKKKDCTMFFKIVLFLIALEVSPTPILFQL